MNNPQLRRITTLLIKVYHKNWAETNIDQIFDDLNDQIANRKVPGFSNTIHQIARYILATEGLVIKRLQRINYKLTPEEDWPPAESLKNVSWADTRNAIRKSDKALIKELSKKTDTDLHLPILDNHSTVYETLHGHIQHSYYHIGQIGVIKKWMDA